MQRAARTANTPPKSSTSVLTARIDSVIHTASAVKPFDGLGVAPRERDMLQCLQNTWRKLSADLRKHWRRFWYFDRIGAGGHGGYGEW